MTIQGAPAPTTALALATRVLWVEGRLPAWGEVAATARLAAPRFAADDGRCCFAVGSAAVESLALARHAWPADAPLPSSADGRWQHGCFVLPAPRRADERHLALRRALLPELPPEFAQALAEFERPRRRLALRDRALDLERGRPQVMAVLNLTPDSFSDGGRLNVHSAVERGLQLAEAGVALLDIGGESTRPGAQPIGVEEELARVLPVIERLARRVAVPLSIDTTKAAVARAALAAGAALVNDTSALADDEALAGVVREAGAGVVLMHRLGTPLTMQQAPSYVDCAAEVAAALAERARAALAAGIARDAIVLDPGLGFGKRHEDNLDLVAALASLRSLGFPLLLGASRKSFLGALTGRAAPQRDAATLATTAAAVAAGCELVRVHDAQGSLDVVRVLAALRAPAGGAS